MRVAFVIARVGVERNVVQRLSLALAEEMREQGWVVAVVPFTKKSMLTPPLALLRGCDCVLIANVGLQCAYYSLLKRLGFIKKPFIVIAFGSDIRETGNRLINLFNYISVPVVDLLIPVNPDLVEIAKERGYKNIVYVHNWSEGVA